MGIIAFIVLWLLWIISNEQLVYIIILVSVNYLYFQSIIIEQTSFNSAHLAFVCLSICLCGVLFHNYVWMHSWLSSWICFSCIFTHSSWFWTESGQKLGIEGKKVCMLQFERWQFDFHLYHLHFLKINCWNVEKVRSNEKIFD